ncbi:uncharacterized protein LOC116223395 [Clupea harengus]|uniref:Uncharacterized protein LOC116223395 n=1 Tax=Clupea harengus TaxID=7950 RepID=A0A6P8G8C1_CLUHA|nr:uncharacterized protein LOC116223395 [Clupea harengus]
MVMVQMLEPLTHDDKPMSNMMGELSYRAQYWERDTPGQIREVDTHIPLLLLQELKPYTEYCLRVCVFSLDYNKISNYTHTQCTHTHGQCPVWHVPLGVCAGVCVLVLATLTLLLRKKMGKSPPKYLTPCSLQGPPLSHLHLLHLDQEHCSRAALETAVALTTRGEDSGCGEEMRGVCEEERRGVCEDSGCAEEKSGVCEDSGWYSGEDNSGTSISSQLHKHTHTHSHSHSHCCHGNSTLGTQACLVFQNSQMEPTLKGLCSPPT